MSQHEATEQESETFTLKSGDSLVVESKITYGDGEAKGVITNVEVVEKHHDPVLETAYGSDELKISDVLDGAKVTKLEVLGPASRTYSHKELVEMEQDEYLQLVSPTDGKWSANGTYYKHWSAPAQTLTITYVPEQVVTEPDPDAKRESIEAMLEKHRKRRIFWIRAQALVLALLVGWDAWLIAVKLDISDKPILTGLGAMIVMALWESIYRWQRRQEQDE